MSVDEPKQARVAAVIVTHNSERFLPELIASVKGQSSAPDAVIVIDDHSTDRTRELVQDAGWRIETATTSATDSTTRIAHNFAQGVREARDFDVAILGDHDDYWLPDRVEHQVHLLAAHLDAWLLASNARIMDSSATVRDTFPVPDEWSELSRTKKLRYLLRHSVATGGACALRPARLLDPSTKAIPIPAGWLHDRWWSIAATSGNAIVLDPHPVIEYRVQPDQQVGLDLGRQSGTIPRIRFEDTRKLGAVVRLPWRKCAAPQRQ